MTRKLTKSEMTQAVAAYARSRGFYARTVRTCTALRYEAVAIFKAKKGIV